MSCKYYLNKNNWKSFRACSYALLTLCFSFLPGSAVAQQNYSAGQQAGAELNITPLSIDGAYEKVGGLGVQATKDTALPVPNKLGGRVVNEDSANFNESWTSGETLKTQSLLKGRADNKNKGGMSQEVRLLLSLERSLQSQNDGEIFVLPNISSLFFTARQHALLREARAGFNLRVQSSEDEDEDAASLSDLDLTLGDLGPQPVDQENTTSQEPQKVRTNYIRELVLNGIVYNGPGRWMVWLNDKRITPGDKPEQIVDMDVGENYVELRWYDGFQEKIFPVRLRSGQRFNLDTRGFASAGGGDAS